MLSIPRALPPVTHGSAFQAPERLWDAGDMDTYPLAYCPPGSICGMLSIPRALPPVTHGSALQAPECLWFVFYHGFNE